MRTISLLCHRLMLVASMVAAAASCQNSTKLYASLEANESKPATNTNSPQLSIDALGSLTDGNPTMEVGSGVQDHDPAPLSNGAFRRFITAQSEQSGPFIQSRLMTLSQDGRYLAVPDFTKKIRLWNVETGKEFPAIKILITPIIRLMFSPDGKKLVSLCYNNMTPGFNYTIHLWEIATGKELVSNEWDHSTINSMPFSPDGKILASGSEIGVVHLWDVETGKERQTLQGPPLEGTSNAIKAIAFSSDGNLLTSVEDYYKTIRMWEVASGKEIQKIQGGGDSVIFSPDNTMVASWGRHSPAVQLWEVSSGRELHTLGKPGQLRLPSCSSIRAVFFSPNGRSLISMYDFHNVKGGLENSWVVLWDVANGKKVSEIDGSQHSEMGGAFTLDSKAVAFANQTVQVQTIRLWDVAAGEIIKQIDGIRGFAPFMFSPVFSSDKRILATLSKDNTISLWNVADGKLVRQFSGHHDYIDAMTFSADGKILASASADGTILLWKVE